MQEALNNIVKHAKATEVSVLFESDAEYIELEICDNGEGFEYNDQKVFDEENPYNTHGLRNMKERAELIGATFNLNSTKGKGTNIRVEVPLDILN